MMTKGVFEQNDRSGSAFRNTAERAKGIERSEQAAPQDAILMAPITPTYSIILTRFRYDFHDSLLSLAVCIVCISITIFMLL